MKRLFLFLSFVFAFSIFAHADFLDHKVVKLGEAVPDFTLQDLSGQTHQLSDYKGKTVMIHFWSATCPFVIRYHSRLNEIADEYGPKGVVVLAIDSNSNETPEQMKQVAEERGVNYPILVDPANVVADQFGAITTPHVFVIDPDGKLAYEGAVDDQGYAEHNKVGKTYTRDALDSVLSSAPVAHPQTKSVGCTVKRAF
jgi:peroxiredoxin